ncbi:MAG TPA: type II toxin-antitoxin system VapC family toxin [Stellaceae bacterium]|nr:type II toxin-antitoxin system VapC family toxin [Stellaceae bacterium]
MSLVLDASTTLGWYFEDERNAAGDDILDRVTESGAVVPILWRYEVANGLQMAVRRKRIDQPYRDASLAELRLLPITIDRAGDDAIWSAMLGLSDRFGLTIYDAAYLEVAHRRGLPLATGDLALQRAAQMLAVDLIASR